MAWIESHQSMARHPKLIRLAKLLRVNKAQAIGHLHLFWWWTLDYAPKGDVSVFASHEIGSAAEWTGDAERFHQALIECGWIDADGFVHDWHDYAGKLVEKRESDRERKRVKKDSDGIPAEVHRKSQVHNPTQPNRTQPNQPADAALPPPLRVERFTEAWGQYVQHRKEIKKPLTPTGERQALARCEKWGVDAAVTAIETAISNGWQGLFEPKGGHKAADPDNEIPDQPHPSADVLAVAFGGGNG